MKSANEEWVSTIDRLPTKNSKVLAVLENSQGARQMVVLKKVEKGDHDWTLDGGEIAYHWSVTHWRKLPSLPKVIK